MNFAINGIAIIEAQNPNLSSVSILNAFSPRINFGSGVVPPLPNKRHKKNDTDQAKNLLFLVIV